MRTAGGRGGASNRFRRFRALRRGRMARGTARRGGKGGRTPRAECAPGTPPGGRSTRGAVWTPTGLPCSTYNRTCGHTHTECRQSENRLDQAMLRSATARSGPAEGATDSGTPR
eukprot:1177722-Prorocentrum_minimum.AAC.3